MFKVKQAHDAGELASIIQLRYTILRAPWQQPIDTASDDRENTSVNAYIADDSGNVIACGRLQENEGRIGQIRYMAVHTDYQGKGLGKLILQFLEQEAKAMNLQKIELQARENALAFYRSAGYELKETTFLLWGIIQHYRMEKTM